MRVKWPAEQVPGESIVGSGVLGVSVSQGTGPGLGATGTSMGSTSGGGEGTTVGAGAVGWGAGATGTSMGRTSGGGEGTTVGAGAVGWGAGATGTSIGSTSERGRGYYCWSRGDDGLRRNGNRTGSGCNLRCRGWSIVVTGCVCGWSWTGCLALGWNWSRRRQCGRCCGLHRRRRRRIGRGGRLNWRGLHRRWRRCISRYGSGSLCRCWWRGTIPKKMEALQEKEYESASCCGTCDSRTEVTS